jgi:outer membrane receptor protein involved in Fe transport
MEILSMVRLAYRKKSNCIIWNRLGILLALLAVPIAKGEVSVVDNVTYSFDIQDKPLKQALGDFTEFTEQQIVVQPDNIIQYNSPTVSAMYNAEQALSQLVNNSGLLASSATSSAFVVQEDDLNFESESKGKESAVEKIIVVGSKTGETRQEIATSVGYFGEEQIRDQVIYNVEDAFERTANASVGNSISGAYSVRGVNTDGIAGSLNRSNALASILINHVALGMSAGNYVKPTLFDATSVEILRGPQSTLQGPNALIGSVYINYNRPDFYGYEGSIRAETGQYDTQRLSFMQNVVLVEDTLAARLVAETRQSNGDVVNTTTGRDDVMSEDENTLRLALRWQPLGDEDLVFDLTYMHNKSETNATAFVVSPTGGDLFDREQPYNIDDEFPSDFDFLSLEASWQLNDHWILISDTGFNKFSLDQRFDGDLSAFELLVADGFINEELFSQEFRLNYQGESLSSLIGLFYSNGEYNNGFTGKGVFPDGMGGTVPFNSVTESTENIEQYAVFGQLNWYLVDDWVVQLGARLNREERTTDDYTNNGFVVDLSASKSFNQFIPSLTIAYDLSESIRLGVSYSKGFQAGGISFAVFQGEAVPYDEESIDNYELFLRQQYFDGKLRLNVNVFYFDWSDQQVTTTLAGGVPIFDDIVVNTGESEVTGAEFEVEWQASSHLNLFVNFGITDTEFKQFMHNGVDLAGMSFPQAPEFTANLGGLYQSDNGFFTSLTYSYTDKTYSRIDSPQFTKIQNRSLLSGRFGYQQDDWRAYIWGNNLLDDEYELFVQDGRAFGIPAAYGSVGASRALGIGLQLDW